MAVDSETREERKRKAQMELKDLRAGVRDLLRKESLQSEDLSGVIMDYVLFLHRMPVQCYENKSDVVVDLDILKELGRKCEHESDKAKQEYFERQFSFIYALRKKAMMQQELRGILESPDGIPDAFRDKCGELLEDSDWDAIIERTKYMEKEWKTQADETNENVAHLLIDTIEADPIDVNDLDQVKQQFKSYSDEVTKSSRDMDENLTMCVEAPKMCQSVKTLVRFLEKKSCSSYFIPADDIKVDKASQDVHCSIQSEDGGRVDKGSQDAHCSMQSKDGGSGLSYDKEERDAKKNKEKMAAQLEVVQQPQQPMPLMPQQMLPRGGRMYDYPPGPNMPEGAMPGIAGGMPSVPYDMAGNPMRDAVSQPIPIGAVATASPDQQRTMLGENLYPDQLEHEMAAKVTGMLLEMDQTEALYLLESPEELKAKVAEALKLLRKERSAATATI